MRAYRWLFVVALTCGIATVACEDEDNGAGDGGVRNDAGVIGGNGGTAGAGGTAGTGGTAGAGGTAGTGGTAGAGGTAGSPGAGGTGGSSACTFPSCLNSLLASCVPSGACTRQMVGLSFNTCFANGVKWLFSVSTTGATQRVTKPDGSTCYTVEFAGTGSAAGQFSGTYRNAAGAAVATASVDAQGRYTVTCTGGSPQVISGCTDADAMRAGVGGAGGGSGQCMMGTCM